MAQPIILGGGASNRPSGALRAPPPAATGYVDVAPIAFGATRTPSTTRPVHVLLTAYITCDKDEDGRIFLQVGGVTVAEMRNQYLNADAVNASSVAIGQVFSVIVPTNTTYGLNTSSVSGAPAFTFVEISELTL